MDFDLLFDVDRLFDNAPPSSFEWGNEFLYSFIAIAIVAFVTRVFASRVLKDQTQKYIKALVNQISTVYFWLAAIGIFLVLARTQFIQFFSMRFFLLTLILTLFGFAIYYITVFFTQLPGYQARLSQSQKQRRYLPQAKKSSKKRKKRS